MRRLGLSVRRRGRSISVLGALIECVGHTPPGTKWTRPLRPRAAKPHEVLFVEGVGARIAQAGCARGLCRLLGSGGDVTSTPPPPRTTQVRWR